MKTLALIASFLLATAFIPSPGSKHPATHTLLAIIPERTVIIKHPGAEDTDKFFSGSLTFTFEVYKAGSKEQVAEIVETFQQEEAVQSLVAGKKTGDYQAFQLTLKTARIKPWFTEAFQKARLHTILINNHPVVNVDNM